MPSFIWNAEQSGSITFELAGSSFSSFFDLSVASTETKYVKLKTKTQNNIVIFGFSLKK